tara:strand:+ start:1638 stop:2789 length:1152 start_codon:yes stop_codon:yes gene_type:complete
MKYKQTGGKVPKGMRKKTSTYRPVKKERTPGGHGRRKTGALLDPSDERKMKRKIRRAKRKLNKMKPIVKKQGGGMIEESKEIKFGGPHKMKKGGAPGALKRAAKKTAKGKANVEKGMKMIGEANTKKETRKAGRTMAKGIRQKKAGARKKANYEFRQSVKRGEVRPTTPPIANLKNGGGVDKKFLGGLGRLAGAVKGFRAGKGQGLGARLKGAAKGAAGGGMMGRAFGALKGMRGAAGQGGGLRGMMKAGAQGAMQGAFGGGAQQNAAEAAPAEGMEEEMKRGGMKDRRKMGGCKKGEPCEAYDGGRGPKKPKRRRRKGAGKFKTRVSNIGRRKYENGGDCGPGGCTGENKTSKRNKKYAREAKRAARRRARNRGRGRGRPKV